MTATNLLSRLLIAVVVLAFAADGTAFAQGQGRGQGNGGQGQGGGDRKSCSQAEVREAEQRSGGRMMSVSQSSEGGSTVCRITVLVPSQGDGKPRRTVVTVRP
ncbi:hypothetical protein FP2506_11212 [Fulvimarina pelagi HTCC2506]|uniref:Secreted protein n=1 Tax=Fulvimarina pelagi HTCC2506 TaxID=314231 RepID=Q0FZ37_9HYPH|nr:hypothetical protein [Fulvimarina pelagi]EAU40121.1 hypothetical protein FP2506_11212 [Fulvimarina pelagi HTCC2506]